MNIFALIWKDFLLFWQSKSSVVLAYLAPMLITIIFGSIFGGVGNNTNNRSIDVILINQDNSELSNKVEEFIRDLEGIKVINEYEQQGLNKSYNLQVANSHIKKGLQKIGIVIPKGFGEDISSGKTPQLKLNYDPRFQVELALLTGLIQKNIISELPQLITQQSWKRINDTLGEEQAESFKSDLGLTISKYFPIIAFGGMNIDNLPIGMFLNQEPLKISKTRLLGDEDENIMFSQYVAGIAVIFLLFSVSDVGASLIEEINNGTMNRLLIAPISVHNVLISKLLFSCILGITQLIVLFTFGWLIFDLNIFKDVYALLIMIFVTSLACSSLGMLVASFCKNKHQVNTVSTLIVLGMSALGGSMFPTFIMPEYLQEIGRFTLNFWAMKGFSDILWHNLHINDILASISVLILISLICISIAQQIFQRRIYRS